jgi:hypothetical protein
MLLITEAKGRLMQISKLRLPSGCRSGRRYNSYENELLTLHFLPRQYLHFVKHLRPGKGFVTLADVANDVCMLLAIGMDSQGGIDCSFSAGCRGPGISATIHGVRRAQAPVRIDLAPTIIEALRMSNRMIRTKRRIVCASVCMLDGLLLIPLSIRHGQSHEPHEHT